MDALGDLQDIKEGGMGKHTLEVCRKHFGISLVTPGEEANDSDWAQSRPWRQC